MRRPLREGLLLAGLLAAMVLGFAGSIGCSDDGVVTRLPTIVRGSGVIDQEDRFVSGCAGVNVSSIGNLHIEQGAQEALTIRAEDNLLRHLVTELRGGTLTIRTADDVQLLPRLSIDFYLTVVDLESILHTGVGDVDGTDLTLDTLTLTQSGVGEVDLDALDTTGINTVLSGVGDVWLAGRTDEQVLTLSGVGDYEAGDLASSGARVTITGHGSATVRVSALLIVNITGSGSVYYFGDPVVDSTITGTGGVVRLGP